VQSPATGGTGKGGAENQVPVPAGWG